MMNPHLFCSLPLAGSKSAGISSLGNASPRGLAKLRSLLALAWPALCSKVVRYIPIAPDKRAVKKSNLKGLGLQAHATLRANRGGVRPCLPVSAPVL